MAWESPHDYICFWDEGYVDVSHVVFHDMTADIRSVCLYGIVCIVVCPYDTISGLDQSKVESSGAAEKGNYRHAKDVMRNT